MNEFVVILKSINFKNGKTEKLKFWKFSNSMDIKKIFSHSHSNLFSSTSKKQSKKMKQNQLNDCKVKILENQSEFDILTKDSVWNIEKWALIKRKNKRNNI